MNHARKLGHICVTDCKECACSTAHLKIPQKCRVSFT